MHEETFREKIQEARRQFKAGLPVDPALVRPVILESWERSRSYDLTFDVLAKKRPLGQDELSRRIQERRTLYDAALPFMKSLHAFTSGSGFLSTLTDEGGYVLKTMGDPDILRKAARDNGMVEGCNRSERWIGTNGIGTTLITREPLQVVAGEHYYPLHPDWICSGAPIFDPEGNTIGVFCMTGLGQHVSFHTLGMAAAAAAAISQQVKMQRAYDTINRIQQRTRVIVETIPSGILLLDRHMKVVQSNSRADQLLGKPGANLVGLEIAEIFDGLPSDMTNQRKAIEARNVSMRNGDPGPRFTVGLQPTATDEFLLTFERTESVHRRVHRIIGSEAHFTFEDIIGRSRAIEEAVSLARIASGNASNVLLTGESGTGKELFAQAIHNASTRCRGPFVAINCGALPKSLIESELFGYVGGAFTGAKREGSVGKFELANGGTIFLDEIGDMPFEVQATLLRVLQNKEIDRLGSNRAVSIDVRIIAATNQDLLSAIASSSFRSDLYYRLNVFSIRIPPLRERGNDIRLLARYFLQKYVALAHKNVLDFTDDAYDILERQPWPGNVRELENMVERVVYLADTPYITANCLSPAANAVPVESGLSAPPAPARRSGLTSRAWRNDKETFEDALSSASGNVKKAAALLGISRRTMYRKMELLGIDYDEIRSRAKP